MTLTIEWPRFRDSVGCHRRATSLGGSQLELSCGELTRESLTVSDVAELLQLNQQTVRNWIDAGTLPAIRAGRRVRVRRSDLETVIGASTTIEDAAEPRPSRLPAIQASPRVVVDEDTILAIRDLGRAANSLARRLEKLANESDPAVDLRRPS